MQAPINHPDQNSPAPVVKDALALAVGLGDVKVGPEQGNDELGKEPGDPGQQARPGGGGGRGRTGRAQAAKGPERQALRQVARPHALEATQGHKAPHGEAQAPPRPARRPQQGPGTDAGQAGPQKGGHSRVGSVLLRQPRRWSLCAGIRFQTVFVIVNVVIMAIDGARGDALSSQGLCSPELVAAGQLR